MSQKLPYTEGDWFAVPLHRGGCAVGLIARAKRGILLGYFFGPRRTAVPSISELGKLLAKDALRVLIFGDLGLVRKDWPIIGQVVEWKREDWPMPAFIRREEFSGRMWRVYYRDDDPSEVESEERIYRDPGDLLNDALSGHIAVERLLDHLLD